MASFMVFTSVTLIGDVPDMRQMHTLLLLDKYMTEHRLWTLNKQNINIIQCFI